MIWAQIEIPEFMVSELEGAIAERLKQVQKYDSRHDDHHENGEIAVAASLYALPQQLLEYRIISQGRLLGPILETFTWKGILTKRLLEDVDIPVLQRLDTAIALLMAERSRVLRLQEKNSPLNR